MTEVQVRKDIKETLEVIDLVVEVAKLIYREVQGDGLQLSDAAKIVLNSEFQSKLASAIAGISQVPDEFQDLSTVEAFTVAKRLLSGAEEVLQVARKAA